MAGDGADDEHRAKAGSTYLEPEYYLSDDDQWPTGYDHDQTPDRQLSAATTSVHRSPNITRPWHSSGDSAGSGSGSSPNTRDSETSANSSTSPEAPLRSTSMANPGTTHPPISYSCMQCASLNLPCSRTLPACSRCVRRRSAQRPSPSLGAPADPCLVREIDAHDGTIRISRLPTDDAGAWAAKQRAADRMRDEKRSRDERGNWALPRPDHAGVFDGSWARPRGTRGRFDGHQGSGLRGW